MLAFEGKYEIGHHLPVPTIPPGVDADALGRLVLVAVAGGNPSQTAARRAQ